MKPLENIRILAIEQFGAGPYGSSHLAELGADIIKIEDPRTGGDSARTVPPFAEDEDSLYFETFNRNKRSISLDLESPAGRKIFEDLVRESDAVYSNLRGDVPVRLGIQYDDLAHINPRIVCCSLTGFGMEGPRQAEPAYDYILQGLTGWMSLTGEPGSPPAKSGLSIVDFSGGLVAALSLMAGLHSARRDGIGMDCDVSLFDTAMSMLSYVATWQLTEGHEPERMARSAHPSLVPFQAFEAADGWIVVGCAKEKFWSRLAPAIGRADLATDPRFATFEDRKIHRDALLTELDAVFHTASASTWVQILTDAQVPCGPVNDVAAALADEQVESRSLLVEVDHPRFGNVRTLRSPVRVGDTPAQAVRAPRRGEHTADVLRSVLGLANDAISVLQADGAFGDCPALRGKALSEPANATLA